MEEEYGRGLVEDPEVPMDELHGMFIEDPDDSPVEDPGEGPDNVEPDDEDADDEGLFQDLDDEGLAEDLHGDDQPGDVSSESVQMSLTTRPRRTNSAPRHPCTEVDPNTGEPCTFDFSRAG